MTRTIGTTPDSACTASNGPPPKQAMRDRDQGVDRIRSRGRDTRGTALPGVWCYAATPWSPPPARAGSSTSSRFSRRSSGASAPWGSSRSRSTSTTRCTSGRRATRGPSARFLRFSVNWYGTPSRWRKPCRTRRWCRTTRAGGLALRLERGGPASFPFLPALGVILGTQALAGNWTRLRYRPRSSSLCPRLLRLEHDRDVRRGTLCSWVWAIVLWIRGLREDRQAAGGRGGPGRSGRPHEVRRHRSPPLLAGLRLMKGRRSWPRLAWLLLPVLVLGLRAWTRHLYGRGLLLQSMTYAREVG
jgi:hypothetical protein